MMRMSKVDEICLYFIEKLEDRRYWCEVEYDVREKFGVGYRDWNNNLWKIMGGLMDVGIVMKVKWMRYGDYMCNCVVVEDVRCIWKDVEVE